MQRILPDLCISRDKKTNNLVFAVNTSRVAKSKCNAAAKNENVMIEITDNTGDNVEDLGYPLAN
jgi:hypothetical protein